jgi:hypothetical protein
VQSKICILTQSRSTSNIMKNVAGAIRVKDFNPKEIEKLYKSIFFYHAANIQTFCMNV